MPLGAEQFLSTEQALSRASKLVAAGQHAHAKAVLLSVEAELGGWPEDLLGCDGLTLLARCYRLELGFSAARGACRRALRIARSIDQPSAQAVALEGLALVEAGDGHIRLAADCFAEAAELEGRIGNFEGRSAVLMNYANMLLNRDIEGAEPLLREALGRIDRGSQGYPSTMSNLAAELARQGRYPEAVQCGEAAVELFLATGRSHDAFLAMRTLARALAGAGRADESGAIFTRAHDLIRDLRRSAIDEAHYASYHGRIRGIEAKMREILGHDVGQVPEQTVRIIAESYQIRAGSKVDLKIAVHTRLGTDVSRRGIRELEAGQYSAALESFAEALGHWGELKALHKVLEVNCYLALAYAEVGDKESALPLALDSRAIARGIADAGLESMALGVLAMLSDGSSPGPDALDYLIQAQALERCHKRQAGIPEDSDAVADGGVIAGQLALICAEAQALDLAESYFQESLRAGRAMPEILRHRFIGRLYNYYYFLDLRQQADRSVEILAELRAAAAAMLPDPRINRALARATSRGAFNRGDRTQEVLDALLDECRWYEEERGQARNLDLTGFAHAKRPPYEDAAEVALALGDIRLALRLLELGKARTLVEARDAAGLFARRGQRPDLISGGVSDVLPAINTDIGLSLFVNGSAIRLFRLDGATGELTHSDVEDTGEAGQRLVSAVRAFTDAADSELADHTSTGALDAVLEHPAFRQLACAVAAGIPDDRTAWLAPHGYLHNAPLQLLGLASGSSGRFSIVPSLSVASRLPPARAAQGRSGLTVCGDSLGDLPYARAEARLVAGTRGALAVGAACTQAWVQSAITLDTGIVHVACHGRYDHGRPARSGLILAARSEDQLAGTLTAQLLTVPEAAALKLAGAVIVLSACSSGMAAVRTGDEASGLVTALLAAGAATVIAAQWRIDDLSAMLLMTRFHRRLSEQAMAGDLLAVLESAAADVRDLTSADLVESVFEDARQLQELGGTQAEAIRLVSRCLSYTFRTLGDEASAKLQVLHDGGRHRRPARPHRRPDSRPQIPDHHGNVHGRLPGRPDSHLPGLPRQAQGIAARGRVPRAHRSGMARIPEALPGAKGGAGNLRTSLRGAVPA
jgi:tetratricopeptide (TPR) repeat protein